MDKEQIIIDDVDVSKCRYFCGYGDLCKNDNIGRVVRPLCKRIPDCYFKQLARKTQEYNTCHTELVSVSDQLKKKTQECEELKKKLMQKDEINTFLNAPIEGWSNNPCDICESKNNYERLNQECEELTKERDYLKQIVDGCPDVACENGGFCAIDIENKRLRKEYEVLEKQLAETKTYDLFSEKIIEKLNTDQIMVSIFQDYSRYRKALEEIEGIIIPIANKNPVDNCWNLISSCDECAEKEDCKSQSPYFRAKQILDIINKAKGEG